MSNLAVSGCAAGVFPGTPPAQIAIDAPNGRKGGVIPAGTSPAGIALPGHDPAVRGWNLAEGKRIDHPYLDG